MASEKAVHLSRLRELIAHSRELRRTRAQGEQLNPLQYQLAEWQASRLARTYSDLSSQRRYKLAMAFFLTDLYGPKDFSQRDQDIERVYPMMAKVLSGHAIQSITLALELHAISQALDTKMVAALTQMGVQEIDAEAYSLAYRQVGDRPARQRQIDLVLTLGEVLDSVVGNPLIYAAIKVARAPAHAMGFGELQDFVERGFTAFKKLRGAKPFLDILRERETRLLEAMFDGADTSDLLD